MTHHFELIDDEGAAAPECVISGLGDGGFTDTIIIHDVCQDPDSLNIVYFNVSISGPFNYQLSLEAQYDHYQTREPQVVHIANTYIPGYPNSSGLVSGNPNSTLRINTMCTSMQATMAFNCGSAIEDFANLTQITFVFRLLGSFDNIIFQDTGGIHDPLFEQELVHSKNLLDSTDPTATIVFYKGITLDPWFIYFDPDTNELKIVFSNVSSEPCLCAINCQTPTIDDYSLPDCEEQLQSITVDANTIIGDPTDVLLTFLDVIGNTTNFDIQAIAGVIPKAPSVALEPKPFHTQIGINYVSVNTTPIDHNKVSYQLLKYTNKPDNFEILKDWSSKKWSMFYDKDIRPGHIYGYAVKF